MYNFSNDGSETENSGIKTSTLAREHASIQGTLAHEHVSTQGMLACEHIGMLGTLAREHVSMQGTQACKACWHMST